MPLMNRDSMELSGSLWWLFILDTILIAAGGYVINDIFDQQADFENKPENQFIGKNHLSVKMAWFYYFVLIATGFIIATYIAYEIEKPHLLLIYPAACALLFLYSYSFLNISIFIGHNGPCICSTEGCISKCRC